MIKYFTRFFFSLLFIIFFGTSSHAYTLWSDDYKAYEKEFVKVYPNPVVNTATIKISKDIDLSNDKVSFTIYNIMGNEVFRVANVEDDIISISHEKFSPGLYFFQLRSNNKVISSGRITFK